MTRSGRSRLEPRRGAAQYYAQMEAETGIEAECWQFEADLTAGPISPEEYRRLLLVRKSGAYPPLGAEYDQWKRLVCRFHRAFPNTTERAMWHEAGHTIVAHRLGCVVHRIQRDDEGTPGAVIERPDAWEAIDEATVTVAGWIAEAMASYPELTDPTHEVANLAIDFRTSRGERLPPWERIKFVEVAEERAKEMLDADWSAVERVATLAMAALPVEREALVEAIKQAGAGT
jgi:hypothetical protein